MPSPGGGGHCWQVSLPQKFFYEQWRHILIGNKYSSSIKIIFLLKKKNEMATYETIFILATVLIKITNYNKRLYLERNRERVNLINTNVNLHELDFFMNVRQSTSVNCTRWTRFFVQALTRLIMSFYFIIIIDHFNILYPNWCI